MIELIAGDWAAHYTHLQAQIACTCWSCCSAARPAARCGRSSARPAPSPGTDRPRSREKLNAECLHFNEYEFPQEPGVESKLKSCWFIYF